MSGPVRTLLVWCPDWPVIAAGLADGVPVHSPVAVLAANRVLACSPAARTAGVRRGLRKREAQGRCPELVVVEDDPGRDARVFEPVVAAVEGVAPSVEVVRPGACALAARGPARYFGTEERAAELIVEQVAQSTGVEAQIGIADGIFAAELAALAGILVPPGETPAFLSGHDVSTLNRPQLTDLLRRLGVRTIGDFAALPAGDVLARFGLDAALAHRLAAGRDEAPLAVRLPPADLTVERAFDDPLDRVDVAEFAARALAERLHGTLGRHGLACTRLGIEAVTCDGAARSRTWRHDGLLDEAAIADRVRWQLDGWLSQRNDRPAGGIVLLRLVPDGVIPHVGLQPGLWGDMPDRARAHRALTRVQGLLGPDGVVTAVPGGGRGPVDQVRLVPWGDERTPARPGTPTVPGRRGAAGFDGRRGTGGSGGRRGTGGAVAPPWPGRLPPPAPATVFTPPLPATVLDAAGRVVGVTARLDVTAQPAEVGVGGEPSAEVIAWAGPWPVDERWWAPREACRLVRFQVYLADGRALLMALRSGAWFVEAAYD